MSTASSRAVAWHWTSIAGSARLRKLEWVVYAKRPFAGPEAVLAYLSRYTHRVAISNSCQRRSNSDPPCVLIAEVKVTHPC